jgi:protein SCO1
MNNYRCKFARVISLLIIAISLTLMQAITLSAQIIEPNPPAELKGVDVTEHLGEKIPLDLVFTNDAGEKVPLRNYFKGDKPVILVLAYYECPMLCTLVLNGVAKGLHDLDWVPGQNFQVLTISIDSTETVQLAHDKRANLLPVVGKQGSEEGWRFFVGDGAQIRTLADTLGFHYYYDPKLKQFAHPAVVMVLSGDGRISRYLYGIEFKKQDLKLALLEASQGKVGTTVDRIILFCYHYNPEAKGYVLFATNLMKLGGILTVIFIAIFLSVLWRRELRKKQETAVTP